MGAAAVRDADAAVQAGRHLRLARRDIGEEGFEVGDAPGGGHPFGERAGGGLLRVGKEVDVDQVCGDELAHRAAPRGRTAGAAVGDGDGWAAGRRDAGTRAPERRGRAVIGPAP